MFFLLRGDLVQIQRPFGNRLERLAFELGQVRHQPLVHSIGQQQNFQTFLAEDFQVRAVLGGGEAVGADVVNLILSFLHPADVIRQRDSLFGAVVVSRGKAQQLGDLLAIAMILRRPLLDDPPKILPELAVFLGIVGRHVLQQPQHFLDRSATNAVHDLAALQDFAGDVERQVVGIDHAAHEAQITRHQMLGIVHDEHPLYVQLHPVTLFAIPEIERCAGRDKQQRGVFQLALDPVVGPGQRVFEIVTDMLVELLVLLFLDVLFGSRPQRRRLIDAFLLNGRWRILVFAELLYRHQHG